MPTHLLLLLGALVPSQSACDRGEQEQPPAQNWDVQDGGNLPATGPTYSDEDFHFEAQAPAHCEPKEPMLPADGFVRLSFPILIRAKSDRAVPVSAMSFTLETEAGKQFRPTLAGCHPAIAHQKLANKQSLKAHVAFDVPAHIQSWELTFHPFLLGRKEVRARVKVPRN